jgi:hypothetical protein
MMTISCQHRSPASVLGGGRLHGRAPVAAESPRPPDLSRVTRCTAAARVHVRHPFLAAAAHPGGVFFVDAHSDDSAKGGSTNSSHTPAAAPAAAPALAALPRGPLSPPPTVLELIQETTSFKVRTCRA